MTAAATQALITQSITDFGTSALVILGALIVLGVGFLVFRMGWSRLKGMGR